MSRKEAQGLLEIASEQVPLGVYGIEKNDHLDLRNDICESVSQVKDMARRYKKNGFKVYANKKVMSDAL